MDNTTELSVLLRSSRKALKLTQQQLAETLWISDGRTVRRWEAGDREVPGPVWVALMFILRKAGHRAQAATIEQMVKPG